MNTQAAMTLLRRRDPALCRRVRVVTSWGLYAVQPIVVRRTLSATLKTSIAHTLLAMGSEPEAGVALAAFGVAGFAPTARAAYEADLAGLGSVVRRAALPVAEGVPALTAPSAGRDGARARSRGARATRA